MITFLLIVSAYSLGMGAAFYAVADLGGELPSRLKNGNMMMVVYLVGWMVTPFLIAADALDTMRDQRILRQLAKHQREKKVRFSDTIPSISVRVANVIPITQATKHHHNINR